MVTIFTTPKPFRGHIGVIQTNAIQSWTLLRPECEVILFGNEDDTAEIATKLRIQHISRAACDNYGTPLVSSMFEIAQDTASFQLVCYANADIILMSDFLRAVSQVRLQSFLLIGRRWNLDINEPINFSDPSWEERLCTHLAETGKLNRPSALDYFVFTTGLYNDIPPFTIGRPGWDNWMVYRARSLRVPVIDATKAITAIHQNHDYSHHFMGIAGVYRGKQAKKNLRLLGGREHAFGTHHATWILTRQGIKRAFSFGHLCQRMLAIPVFFPPLAFLNFPINLCAKALLMSKVLVRRIFSNGTQPF